MSYDNNWLDNLHDIVKDILLLLNLYSTVKLIYKKIRKNKEGENAKKSS